MCIVSIILASALTNDNIAHALTEVISLYNGLMDQVFIGSFFLDHTIYNRIKLFPNNIHYSFNYMIPWSLVTSILFI